MWFNVKWHQYVTFFFTFFSATRTRLFGLVSSTLSLYFLSISSLTTQPHFFPLGMLLTHEIFFFLLKYLYTIASLIHQVFTLLITRISGPFCLWMVYCYVGSYSCLSRNPYFYLLAFIVAFLYKHYIQCRMESYEIRIYS